MILIVSKNEYLSSLTADMLRYMGVLSYAASPEKTKDELSSIYSAVLFLEDCSETARELADLIRASTKIPIFALADYDSTSDGAFDLTINRKHNMSRIVSDMRKHCIKMGFREFGKYYLGELRACAEENGVIYGEERLPITRAEGNIIKYLVRSHPDPQPSEEILKYVYPERKRPERASLRTHISAINRKFLELFGKNLIATVPYSGYKIESDKN